MCILLLSLSNASILSAQEESSGSLSAQKTESNDNTMLGVVVVTDTGKKTKVLNTNGAVIVFTEKDIKMRGLHSTNELLTSIPGIVDPTNNGGQESVLSIRGTRPSESSGPAVYVNGIPINTGDGGCMLESIPVESIKKIEVLKSPSPALYGKNAGRGVILITTKDGRDLKKDFSASVTGEYGSWKTYNGNAGAFGRLGSLDYSLFGMGKKTEGWGHTDETLQGLNSNLGYSFDGGRAQFIFNYINRKYYSRKSLERDYWELHPRALYQPSKKKNGDHTDKKVFSSGLSVNYDKNGWLGELMANYIHRKKHWERRSKGKTHEDYSVTEKPSHRFSSKIKGGKKLKIAENIFNTIILSSDYNYNHYKNDRARPNAPADEYAFKQAEEDYTAQRHTLGVSLYDEFQAGIFNVSGGVRLNNVKYKVEYPTKLKENDSDYFDFDKTYKNNLDWSLASSVALVENSNLFISYSHSNSYRTSFPRSNAENRGKPGLPQIEDLKPEKCLSLETGFKHQYNEMLNYSLVFYKTKIIDKVLTYYEDDNAGVPQSKGKYNAGTTRHEGIEIDLDGRLFGLLGYRFAISTTKAMWDKGHYRTKINGVKTLVDMKGKQRLNIPFWEYDAGIDIYPTKDKSLGTLIISFDINGLSHRHDNELNTNDRTRKSVYFVNSKVDYIYENIEVFLNCNNLLDTMYFKGSKRGYTHEGRYVGLGCTVTI